MSQIADGENGGVMMNEFPAYQQANQRIRDDGNDCVAINGSEYLELLDAAGVDCEWFPRIQAVQQQRLWAAVGDTPNPAAVQTAITSLQAAGDGFSMEGASWTNNLSWVQGYDNVLEPMNQLSAHFHQRFDGRWPQIHTSPARRPTRRHCCTFCRRPAVSLLGPGYLDRLFARFIAAKRR